MTTNEGAAGAVPPAAVLEEVGALRRRARTDRHAYWFPLLLFGVLTVASLPLYVERPVCGGAGVCVVSLPGGPLPLFRLGGSVVGTVAIGWYWLAALLGGGLLTVGWYRWRAARRGVQGRIGVAVLVSLVVLAALLGGVLSWFGPNPAGLSTTHGTSAFLVIAIGLLTLVWLERSAWLGVVAVAYAGASGLATFYDVENLTSGFGWYSQRYSQWPNVLLPALVLLLGGGVAALAARRRRA
jgi:hypothetical protein